MGLKTALIETPDSSAPVLGVRTHRRTAPAGSSIEWWAFMDESRAFCILGPDGS
jgi:hypothetical protein